MATRATDVDARSGPPLGGYAVFAALLSAAGLPIYIHAPKFFVDEYGVSLALLGFVLGGLRVCDVIQDPLLGRLAGYLRDRRGTAVAVGAAAMALGMIGLFAVTPPVAPILWFALMLTLVFSSFSFLNICFYAQGVETGARLRGGGHLRLARWRENGALLGVCAAAILPFVLAQVTPAPLTGFAIGFATLAVVAVVLMRTAWIETGVIENGVTETGTRKIGFLGIRTVLQDAPARRLLLIALVNAAPVAVSSNLFLYFVESRLGALPGTDGVLLLLFFLAAAGSVPIWGGLAQRFGSKPVLLLAMCLAILAFGFALTLGNGDVLPFALICAASGAAMGADLTLLPAAFSARLAKLPEQVAADGFGLWGLVSKLSLALAAVTLLPALDLVGFTPGLGNSVDALWWLTVFYAAIPCALKLVAIGLLIPTPLE